MKAIIFLLIASLSISSSVSGQLQVPAVRLFLEDIDGRPLKIRGVDDVEGTPFLFEDWKTGTVTFQQGSVLSGVQLKFAVYGNQLFFKKGEDMLEFTMPVKEFTIAGQGNKTILFRSLFPNISDNTSKTFYQVLSDGKYQLLKFMTREIRDHKSYSEPVKKKFNDKESLFLFLPNGTIQYVKGEKNALQSLIPEKSDEIENAIKEKKLKLKNEQDLVALVDELNRN